MPAKHTAIPNKTSERANCPLLVFQMSGTASTHRTIADVGCEAWRSSCSGATQVRAW